MPLWAAYVEAGIPDKQRAIRGIMQLQQCTEAQAKACINEAWKRNKPETVESLVREANALASEIIQ